MALVEYSESDSSGSEAETQPKTNAKAAPTQAAPNAKKPFQKVVDRSNPGKILVSLPQAPKDETAAASNEEPLAKRAKTAGGGRFSGFNSFLPAPRNANKPVAKNLGGHNGGSSTFGGFKTSSTPGFSRDEEAGGPESPLNMTLPPPKNASQPSIPDDQKPAEDVKLVGKPLMFKPLSVSRNPKKKKISKPILPKPANAASASSQAPMSQASGSNESKAPPKKVSLFSMHAEDTADSTAGSGNGSTYEPLFEAEDTTRDGIIDTDDYDTYASMSAQNGVYPSTGPKSESLDNIANDLNLSAAERRELFGRGGSSHTAQKVVNFNMDKEYQHNEDLRAAGEQQIHNPVRALQGGKHSLKQLVNNVANQREALEDSFAKGKTNRKEASSKYGW